MQIVQHSGGIPLGLLTIELNLISSSFSARNTLGAVTCHGRFFPLPRLHPIEISLTDPIAMID